MTTPPKKQHFTVKYERSEPKKGSTVYNGARSIFALTAAEAAQILRTELAKKYPSQVVKVTY